MRGSTTRAGRQSRVPNLVWSGVIAVVVLLGVAELVGRAVGPDRPDAPANNAERGVGARGPGPRREEVEISRTPTSAPRVRRDDPRASGGGQPGDGATFRLRVVEDDTGHAAAGAVVRAIQADAAGLRTVAGIPRQELARLEGQSEAILERIGTTYDCDAGGVTKLPVSEAPTLVAARCEDRYGEVMVPAGARSDQELRIRLHATFRLSVSFVDAGPAAELPMNLYWLSDQDRGTRWRVTRMGVTDADGRFRLDNRHRLLDALVPLGLDRASTRIGAGIPGMFAAAVPFDLTGQKVDRDELNLPAHGFLQLGVAGDRNGVEGNVLVRAVDEELAMAWSADARSLPQLVPVACGARFRVDLSGPRPASAVVNGPASLRETVPCLLDPARDPRRVTIRFRIDEELPAEAPILVGQDDPTDPKHSWFRQLTSSDRGFELVLDRDGLRANPLVRVRCAAGETTLDLGSASPGDLDLGALAIDRPYRRRALLRVLGSRGRPVPDAEVRLDSGIPESGIAWKRPDGRHEVRWATDARQPVAVASTGYLDARIALLDGEDRTVSLSRAACVRVDLHSDVEVPPELLAVTLRNAQGTHFGTAETRWRPRAHGVGFELMWSWPRVPAARYELHVYGLQPPSELLVPSDVVLAEPDESSDPDVRPMPHRLERSLLGTLRLVSCHIDRADPLRQDPLWIGLAPIDRGDYLDVTAAADDMSLVLPVGADAVAFVSASGRCGLADVVAGSSVSFSLAPRFRIPVRMSGDAAEGAVRVVADCAAWPATRRCRVWKRFAANRFETTRSRLDTLIGRFEAAPGGTLELPSTDPCRLRLVGSTEFVVTPDQISDPTHLESISIRSR